MPRIENLENSSSQSRYIDRESYDWAREQRGRDNKELFVNATVVIAAFAVYATWTWMIIKKLSA